MCVVQETSGSGKLVEIFWRRRKLVTFTGRAANPGKGENVSCTAVTIRRGGTRFRDATRRCS
jgi:hypothetical protein